MKPISFILLLIVIVFTTNSCSKNNSPLPGTTGTPATSGEYAVFAWNDLGMHCLNPSYDKLVILPPYNNVLVQVVKRGNPPTIVTTGITVSYKILNNTTSYNKRAYGGFWDNALKLFGSSPAHNIGLKGYGLSGDMAVSENHFIAEAIPVVPVDDSGIWSPFQVAEITVKSTNGTVLVQTQATVPTSDEINCAKCHGSATVNAFDDILSKHDIKHSTNLSATTSKPVLCATCHGSPALGTSGSGSSGKYFSEAIHGLHATLGASCYDCHPGTTTKCSRSLAHMGTNIDGNCITCHGDMMNVATSIKNGRIPWATEPKCVTCHPGVTGVDTNTALYRNSLGHGNLYCSACHGSPHAMYPSREITDNYQPTQYQGTKIKSIGSCGICHSNSRGEGAGGEFSGTHGGINPEKQIACHVCHTSISSNTTDWPHAYTWKNSN